MISTATATLRAESETALSEKLQALGIFMTRYGLAVVFAWIGAMKFTDYEAAAIQPLVANSPLMSWLYSIFSVQAFSNWLGVLEIAIAVMIVAGLSPHKSQQPAARWLRSCSWAPSVSCCLRRLCGRQA